jgi:hypothetical protein
MPDQKIIPVIKNKKKDCFKVLFFKVKNTGTNPNQAQNQKLKGGKARTNKNAETAHRIRFFPVGHEP